jgi:predicted DsbA family dithiol-disulfide isomerase
LEREVVAQLLASDADREALAEEEEAARQMGVGGVPCFVIGGRYVVQGAQDVETWKQILTELDGALAKQAAGSGAAPGAAPGAEP